MSYKNLPIYNIEKFEKLEKNQFMLKCVDGVGFMSKHTQKGELPKSFSDWNDEECRHKDKNYSKPIIYLMEEFPREGWKISNWRFGMSQNWAVLRHPLGFTIEVYLKNLLELLRTITVVNCELQGKFYWEGHTLYKAK